MKQTRHVLQQEVVSQHQSLVLLAREVTLRKRGAPAGVLQSFNGPTRNLYMQSDATQLCRGCQP